MSALGIIAQAEAVTTGTAAKTLVQLVAPANQRIKVKEISISFNGISNTATPILVEIVRQTSAGTMSALTLRKADPDDSETIQSSALQNATVEPTDGGDVPMAEYVHPQTGYTWQAPFGEELVIPGGGRLGVRVTAGASVSACARVKGEE